MKTSRTNKDEKQKAHKLKKQKTKTKTTTTTKKARTSTMKDLMARALPKFSYSSYKLSWSKKGNTLSIVQSLDAKELLCP